jgi:predicted oxidoreductase (fatty acid repression mutant protein)
MRPSQLTALSYALLRSVPATSTRTTAPAAPSCLLLRTFTTTSTCPKLVQPQSRTTAPDHAVNIPSPTRPVKMSPTPINSQAVLDLIKARRTYYPLSKDLTISKERIQEIVKEATLHVPSSFNAQSNRVVVLFGEEHDRLWDIATEILKAVVPADQWEGTAGKMSMFKAAAGTVLFFEHEETIKKQQSAYPLYADKFPTWATQSDAMLQYIVWTALEADGLGANLQHYNPLLDARVASQWNIPNDWKLNAQLVFGGRTGEAGPKDFLPIEERTKFFGA